MARQGRSPRVQSRWPIVGVLVGWALVVIVGAGHSVDDSLLGVAGLDDVFTVLLLGAGFVVLMFYIYLNPFSRTFTAPEHRRRSRVGIVLFLVLLLLLWKPELVDWLYELSDDSEVSVVPEVSVAPEGSLGGQAEGPARDTVAEATDVLMLLTALAVVAAVWSLVRSRSKMEVELGAEGEDLGAAETELASAVGQAALALDTEDDPRLGVLKAYAILERTLADDGKPRMQSETPREHLRRSLSKLEIDTGSLLALADLYELARFSQRPITPGDRSRAAALLDDAQRKLLATGSRS